VPPDANNREVLEYNGASGALQPWYAFGLGPDEALNQMNIPANTRTTLIPDVIGSIIGSLALGGTLTKFGSRTSARTRRWPRAAIATRGADSIRKRLRRPPSPRVSTTTAPPTYSPA
jgi:hypothetical protein